MKTNSGRNELRNQYVWEYWFQFREGCQYFAGIDDMNKGLCRHKQNGSFTASEYKPGTKRCNILACPLAKNKIYDAATQKLRTHTTLGDGVYAC
jgi:hypothetical protein